MLVRWGKREGAEEKVNRAERKRGQSKLRGMSFKLFI